jgi:acetylornithine deacetylase
MKQAFKEWININRKRILQNLMSFIEINTVTPNEDQAFSFINSYISQIDFSVEKQPLFEELQAHPLFINNEFTVVNSNRYNIKVRDTKSKKSKGKKVLFNVHIDVVPETKDFKNAFKPLIKDNYLYGRGACDTKNNLIMLIEAIRFLKDNNIKIQKNIEMDLVIEEEVSGNGTLSAILQDFDADVIIVMEPTNLTVFRGHRGCVTANIDIKGKSVHMGSIDEGVNAIECAVKVMKSLKNFESKLLEDSKKEDAFSIWEKPLQINIGKIIGGEWPGSVPENCKFTCNIGFLPNYSLAEIKDEIIKVCKSTGDKWTDANVAVKFAGLKNSAYVVDKEDNNLKNLIASLKSNGKEQNDCFGWRVSCDAHLYNTLTKKPTLIFGSGCLSDAHSAHERVEIGEFELGILVLASYLSKP